MSNSVPAFTTSSVRRVSALLGGGVTAGVVVRDGDLRAVPPDGVAEDLRHARGRRVEGAPVLHGRRDHAVLGVHHQDVEFLAIQHLHPVV